MEKSQPRKPLAIPTVSAILSDGSIVELVFRAEARLTLFAIYSSGRWTLQHEVKIENEPRIVPFSPRNNLIWNRRVQRTAVLAAARRLRKRQDTRPPYDRLALLQGVLRKRRLDGPPAESLVQHNGRHVTNCLAN